MFTSIINAVMSEASIAPFFAAYETFVEALGIFYPTLLVALCLIVGLFGRRMSSVLRVVLLFAIGFVASVYWISPVITSFIPAIPAYAVGLAFGILAAVLSRMIYDFVYIGCIGFDTFNICFNALFLVELTAMTKGNLAISLVVAVIATIIALLLRKYLEMIITAVIGGIGVAHFAKMLVDYTVHFNLDAGTSVVIVGLVLAIPMFIYQYYNRILY